MNRWRHTAIGDAGAPVADALAPAILEWLRAHPDANPWALASIARDVVLTVAAEEGMIARWNREAAPRWSADTIAEAKRAT